MNYIIQKVPTTNRKEVGELISAVILAGGNDSVWTRYAGAPYKALVPIEGITMVSRTVQAFQAVGLEDIIVLGEWSPDGTNEFRLEKSGPDFVANLTRGLELATNDLVLVSTVDMPCINKTAVERFIARCEQKQCSVGYPIVRIEECQEIFPNMKRTAVTFMEGRFTGGNLVWLDRKRFLDRIDIVEDLYNSRKHPFRLSAIIGLSVALRLLVGQCIPQFAMPLEQIEEEASKKLGIDVKTIPATYELGVDIDTPEHLEAFLQTTILS